MPGGIDIPGGLLGGLARLLLAIVGGVLWSVLLVCLLRSKDDPDYEPPELLRWIIWGFAGPVGLLTLVGWVDFAAFALFFLPALGPPLCLYVAKRDVRKARFFWQLVLDFLAMAPLALAATLFRWPRQETRHATTELVDMQQPVFWICLLLVTSLGALRLLSWTRAATGRAGKLINLGHWIAAILLPLSLVLSRVRFKTWMSLWQTLSDSAFFD